MCGMTDIAIRQWMSVCVCVRVHVCVCVYVCVCLRACQLKPVYSGILSMRCAIEVSRCGTAERAVYDHPMYTIW